MYLMHKDDVIAKIELHNNRPVGVSEIYEPNKMPIGTRGNIDFANSNILYWHDRRSIPEGRVNSVELKQAFGCEYLDQLSVRSFGLSLTDHYWYRPENSSISWNDINLYDHSFTPTLLNMRFSTNSTFRISPDFTTNGVLEKYWMCQNNEAILIKAGNFDSNMVPILAANEVVASRIANCMNLPHVEYNRIEIEDPNKKNTYFCSCSSFGIRDEDFVSAESIMNQLQTTDAIKLYHHLYELGFQMELDQMLCFDTLIHNTDRHTNNFGIMYDTNTMKPVCFAPLFDSGNCLNYAGQQIRTDNRCDMKPFYESMDNQVRLIKTKCTLPEKQEAVQIISSVYQDFQIPDKYKMCALKELQNGYDILERRFLELDRGLDFDWDSLFERQSGIEF